MIDVLVIGADATGAMAAHELRRHGLSVRHLGVPTEPRHVMLWSRTLEMLQRTHPELLAQLLETGHRTHATNLYVDGKKLAQLNLDELPSPFPFVLLLDELHLPTQAEPAELLRFSQNRHVTALVQHPDGREETVEAAWMVGCDARVRELLGIHFTEHSPASQWSETHEPNDLDEIEIRWHGERVTARFPLGRVLREGEPGLTVHERLADQLREQRVFLCGKAAHSHRIAAGQNLNLGLGDAFNLAWKLAWVHQGKAVESLLNTYDPERRAASEQVFKSAEAASRVATLRHPVAQYLRDRVARFLASQETVQHRMSRMFAEQALNYRTSALSQEHKGDLTVWNPLAPGVRPGDRVPDADLLEPDGTPTRLYDLLKGAEVLFFSGINPEDESLYASIQQSFPNTIRIGHGGYYDPEHAAHQTFGAYDPTVYWIRPDMHVGFRSQPANLYSLEAYLKSWLLQPAPARQSS